MPEKHNELARKRIGRRSHGPSSGAMGSVTLKQAFDMFFHAKSAEGLRQRTLDILISRARG